MAFVCLAFACSPAGAKAAVRPNIVLILADDLGYGDVGCYGQKRIQTPCIDRLAAEGIRFTQAYAGCTVCAPSRCVLMTGLHTGHCRVRGNGGATPVSQALRPQDVTVARLLQQAGYTTALVGKWGLGDVGAAEAGLPNRQGFDYFYGYLNQTHAHNYYPTFLWRNEEKVPFRGIKRDLYEGGICVPFVAAWPKTIRPGQTSDQSIWFADFLPTATAIAGVKPPKDLDGISVLPSLKGRTQTQLRQRTLYWEFHEGGFKNAVRQADWKLINQGTGKPLELYNLKKDPGETTNLAATQPEEVKRLARFLYASHAESLDWPTIGQ